MSVRLIIKQRAYGDEHGMLDSQNQVSTSLGHPKATRNSRTHVMPKAHGSPAQVL